MDLKELISQGESETVEFKESTGEWKEIIKTISAFTNTKCGRIIIGVSKSSALLGAEIGKDTVESLTNKIFQNTDPKVHPRVTIEKINSKSIIVIDVKESSDHLVMAFGRPYKRIGKSTFRMSKDEYERLILEKHKEKLQFDIQICKGATLKDIDRKKIGWYLEQREKTRNISKKIKISNKKLLQNIKALKKDRLTNAGILFFGEHPQKIFPNARLRIVKFKGNKITNPTLDTANCEGTIWEIINTAEDFIRKNIRLLGRRTEKSFRREDKFEYPIKALREAITNAVIHRDYFETGDVRVFIFDDRIEIINPGRFPKGVTPRNPKHKPVNEILCQLIYDVGFIEKYGSGIYMMKELSEEWGNKEPYYKLHPVETKVIFESSIKESTFIEIPEELNERQKKALKYIGVKGKVMAREYREINNVSKETAWKDISELLKKDLIVKKSSGAHTYYILKANDRANDRAKR